MRRQRCPEMPDLILLDVLMPELDGLAACREIREFTDAPVIFLTALGEEEDHLDGYRSGGDDYIVKPFPLSVLQRKIESAVRRYRGADRENRLSAGGVSVDLSRRTVGVNGEPVRVVGRDFDLLALLMANRGRVLNREFILSRVWGYDYDGDARVVDTHVKRLRRALGEKAGLIRTVVGAGYLFEEEQK